MLIGIFFLLKLMTLIANLKLIFRAHLQILKAKPLDTSLDTFQYDVFTFSCFWDLLPIVKK